jgi:hypothetical protein
VTADVKSKKILITDQMLVFVVNVEKDRIMRREQNGIIYYMIVNTGNNQKNER